MPGCPSTIDRFEALFRCRLIQLPARRSWRLPGRSCWPQLCHQPGHQRQASPCRSCLPACRRGGTRSLSEASARRSAAGATPLPAVRAGGGRGPRSISSRGPCHPPWCLGGDRVRRWSRSLRGSSLHKWPVTLGPHGHCTARHAHATCDGMCVSACDIAHPSSVIDIVRLGPCQLGLLSTTCDSVRSCAF